ncbi:MAG: penicillin-binding protein, partial [Geminicoccaceae bacterium]
YARFHLGDGHAPDGTRLLTPASLTAMRSNPGPGGTLVAEIDGFGVSSALTVLTNSTGGARLKLELF